MDDAQGIVLLALQRAGVMLPNDVQTVGDLRPEQLVPIYVHALTLIRGSPVPDLPTEFPQQRAERFRVCADLVVAFQQLGYRADLSFHQFLYPSEADTHRLLRFLLDQLSQTPTSAGRGRGASRRGRVGRLAVDDYGGTKISAIVRHALSTCREEANQSSRVAYGKESKGAFQTTDTWQRAESLEGEEKWSSWGSPFRTCALRLMPATGNKKQPPLITIQAKPRAYLVPSILELNSRNAERSIKPADAQLIHLARQVDEDSTEKATSTKVISHGILLPNEQGSNEKENIDGVSREEAVERSLSADVEDWRNSERPFSKQQMEISKLEEDISALTIHTQQMVGEIGAVSSKTVELKEAHRKAAENADSLDQRHSLMKAAVDLAVDESRVPDAVLKDLELAVEERHQGLQALQTEWDIVRSRLEEKVAALDKSAETRNVEVQSKLQKMQDVREEVKGMTSKLQAKEVEEGQMSVELEKVAKGASRATYVRRITELIRNSKKQDADIARIINDTRELQREGNMAQDKLRRLHALVDEIVFRDAKRDPVCKQAYRLLTNVHRNFENIVEKVMEMDKIGREISDMQVKLEDLEKQSLDTARVEADLEAVIAENRTLERKLAEVGSSNAQ